MYGNQFGELESGYWGFNGKGGLFKQSLTETMV